MRSEDSELSEEREAISQFHAMNNSTTQYNADLSSDFCVRPVAKYKCEATGEEFNTKEEYKAYTKTLDRKIFDCVPMDIIARPPTIEVLAISDEELDKWYETDKSNDPIDKILSGSEGDITKEEMDKIVSLMLEESISEKTKEEIETKTMYYCPRCKELTGMLRYGFLDTATGTDIRVPYYCYNSLKEFDRHLWLYHDIIVHRWIERTGEDGAEMRVQLLNFDNPDTKIIVSILASIFKFMMDYLLQDDNSNFGDKYPFEDIIKSENIEVIAVGKDEKASPEWGNTSDELSRLQDELERAKGMIKSLFKQERQNSDLYITLERATVLIQKKIDDLESLNV